MYNTNIKQLDNGDHFWAYADNKKTELAVFMKLNSTHSTVCGEWECTFLNNSLHVIAKIEMPKGSFKTDLYYYEQTENI